MQSPAQKTPTPATRKENEAPKLERRLSNRRKSKSDDPELRRRSQLPAPACSTLRTPPLTNPKKEKSSEF